MRQRGTPKSDATFQGELPACPNLKKILVYDGFVSG